MVVATKDHVLRPHLDSLRRVRRSVSDVCMGVDEKSGGTSAIFVIPDLRNHRRYCWKTALRWCAQFLSVPGKGTVWALLEYKSEVPEGQEPSREER